ncbi:MAG: hypothetical protein A2408_00190 [Candidatus Yonathbacteria bacterium RIFOXYC1_FULL_52_10]|uniref:POTRA domain-containing protein n=1 Tax=Candidatus Yonathbacteria bacterium RIFOXYD1_FULL_52_36 TaxID=1802730 RepID=A0A1G2SLY2_9BACT|nr:MAG: hypothetical protein A2408_00190 [Candidatus Yonathbacteria bacterium RIFOXYC1_FULL_52_10]OHA85812.1 MAG: hypothetical protein A2591_00505 [Candidatus Yonathbacteria bacterium RIFOXYD1_FULL_52_36]
MTPLNRTSRDILNTPARAARKKEKRKHLARIAVLLGAVALVIMGLLSWGAHQSSVRIQTIVAEGNRVVSTEEIERVVREAIEGKYILLFPRDNAFLYSEQRIERALLTTHKDLKSIRISFEGLTELSIRVTEREPKALWCGEAITRPSGSCFFMDAQGLVYAQAPDFSPGAYREFYGSLTSTALADDESSPLGNQFWTSEKLTAASALADRIDALVSPVRSFSIEDLAGEIVLAGGGTIILNGDQAMDRLPDILEAAVSTKKGEGKDMVTINYIDLRLADTAGKVYFKFNE